MPSSTRKSGADAVGDVLSERLERDPTIVLLGEERHEIFTERTRVQRQHAIVLPVSDRGTMGVAFGMALAGKRPVVALAGTSRLAAVHEVLAEIGAAAMRGDAVPVIVRVPYGTEAAGLDRPVGQSLAMLEGVHVACGSSGAMVAALLRWALERAGPTVLLEPRSLPARGGGEDSVDPTRARVVREGRDVTLAAWGAGVTVASAAAESLAREGIEADVIDLVSLSPIDHETLGERVRVTGRLVVVHPDDVALAARIHDVALDEAFLYLEAPLAESGASASRVVGAARDAVRY